MSSGRRLLIVGAGGHGKVVADAALASGQWDTLAFLDDFLESGRVVLGIPVVGTFSDLGAHTGQFGTAIAAIGDSQRRLKLIGALRQNGYQLPCVVHPSACVSRFATLGPGTVVLAQAAVNVGATLGVGCIVNTGATVDHDCVLGDGVHLCPGAHLAGAVRAGDFTWIGIGANVREGTVIGSSVTVGVGAAVVANIPDGVTVMGVPAKSRRAP